MAKSMRSKVKRSFRSKKRESGVYAATEAARLSRLNAKLVSLTSKEHTGDAPVEQGQEWKEVPGWCWFAVFGLLDANDITAESLEGLVVIPTRKKGGTLRARGAHIGEA